VKGRRFFEKLVEPGSDSTAGDLVPPGGSGCTACSKKKEHYTARGGDPAAVRELAMLVFQFEGSSAPYVRMENCRNVSIGSRVSRALAVCRRAGAACSTVVGGRDLALAQLAICNRVSSRSSPGGWQAGLRIPVSREILGRRSDQR